MSVPPVLRVPVAGARSVVALVAHRGGTRCERPHEAGYAHLLEHLTSRRGNDVLSGRELARRVERLGADLGAETTFETVAFHVHARASEAGPAARLLAAAMRPGPIAPAALEAERSVVLQELQGYRDVRGFEAERLSGAHEHGDHPLGRSVIGDPAALRAATPASVEAFRSRAWRPAPTVLVLAGEATAVASVDVRAAWSPAEQDAPAPRWTPGPLSVPRPDTGSATLPGLPAEARTTHRLDGPLDLRTRCAVALLAELLGGGGDPLLARRLGLPAGVARARAVCHADVALLRCAYVGARVDERLTAAVDDALAELATDGPPERLLARVRGALVGRTTLALDAPAATAQLAARQALLWGEDPDRDGVLAGLESVAAADVARVAAALRPAGRFLLHADPAPPTAVVRHPPVGAART